MSLNIIGNILGNPSHLGLWILTSFLFIYSLWSLVPGFFNFLHIVFTRFQKERTQERELKILESELRTLEECLKSGVYPSEEQWQGVKHFFNPLGELISHCLEGLRKAGASVLPTLERFRELTQFQLQTIKESRAKASPALAQALICGGLIPLTGFAFSALLPGLNNFSKEWIAAQVLAGGLALGSMVWILRLAELARWGGLKKAERIWVFSSLGAIEQYLSLARSGCAQDLAWIQMMASLKKVDLDLAALWGSSVLTETRAIVTDLGLKSRLILVGSEIKKAIHLSLMEGRPCLDRIMGISESLKLEIKTQIERELGLLGARSLKPLFLLVAPALLGLLSVALFLVFSSSGIELE